MKYYQLIISNLLIISVSLNSWGKSPPLNEIQKEGADFVNSLMSKNYDLLKKSKRSFLLPELKLEADKNRQDTLSIGSTGSGISTDLDNNNRIGFGASVSWDFKGLVYNDSQVKILKDIFSLYEFKLEKLNQITALYFQIEILRAKTDRNEDENIKLHELEERLKVLYEN